jgi:superfamily II DNA helicase RecQ
MPHTHQATGPACAWTNAVVNPGAVVVVLPLLSIVKTRVID